MKRISDYTDDAAFDLLAELIEPIAKILADTKLTEVYKNQSKIEVAKYLLKTHKKEIKEILLSIDETPITAINIIARILNFMTDIEQSPEFKDFFKFAGQENVVGGSFGSATENITENVN